MERGTKNRKNKTPQKKPTILPSHMIPKAKTICRPKRLVLPSVKTFTFHGPIWIHVDYIQMVRTWHIWTHPITEDPVCQDQCDTAGCSGPDPSDMVPQSNDSRVNHGRSSHTDKCNTETCGSDPCGLDPGDMVPHPNGRFCFSFFFVLSESRFFQCSTIEPSQFHSEQKLRHD